MSNRKVPVIEPVSSEGALVFRKQKIMNNPFTLVPVIAGAGGFLIATAWYGLSLGVWWALVGVFGIGVVNLLLDVFVRKGKHQMRYLQEHEYQRKLNISDTSEYIIRECNELGLELPAQQVRKIGEFFLTFEKVLGEKFTEKSITHAEYLGVAERLHIAVLNKLKEVLSQHRSGQMIDQEYIDDGLERSNDSKERDALISREAMKAKQEQEVSSLIAEIEQTLTGLAELTIRVSKISDMSRDASLENLRSQAKILANDTNLYLPEK